MSSDPATVEEPTAEAEEKREQKRKRRSYDVAFKMEVVAYAQAHNKMQAARQYDIHRRCVQTWCKTKEKLEAANSKRMRLAESHQQAPAETLLTVYMCTHIAQLSMCSVKGKGCREYFTLKICIEQSLHASVASTYLLVYT